MVIEIILYILVLITSVPVGLLLAWLCEDEIVVFRKYIIITIYVIILFVVISALVSFNLPVVLSLVYTFFALLIMILKSYRIKKRK